MRPNEVNEFGGFNEKNDNQKPFENELFRVFGHEGLLLNSTSKPKTNYPVEIKSVSRGWVLCAFPFLLVPNEINDIAAKLCGSTSVQRICVGIIRNFNNSMLDEKDKVLDSLDEGRSKQDGFRDKN